MEARSPEIRSLDGNIVAPNGGSNLLVVRGFDISKLDPNNPDGLKFNIRLKAKDSAYERIVPLIFKAKSGSTKITVEVNGKLFGIPQQIHLKVTCHMKKSRQISRQ